MQTFATIEFSTKIKKLSIFRELVFRPTINAKKLLKIIALIPFEKIIGPLSNFTGHYNLLKQPAEFHPSRPKASEELFTTPNGSFRASLPK